MWRPQTLLGRTAWALALAFVLFGLISAALLQVTLVQPHTQQAADDLSAFLVLVAQIWVELPPNVRPDYEREMLSRHNIRVMQTEAAHPTRSNSHAYLHYLQAALTGHIGHTVHIHHHPDHAGWLWADFPMGGRIMRLGFQAERLQNQPLVILPFLAVIGLTLAFGLSILLVRRITRPLAAMAAATRRIGRGDFSLAAPETGARELADLAHKINQLEQQIGQLLDNRTTLLAGISHDLRTPLARMRLEVELIDDADNRELVEGIRGDLDEMERLVAQTLMLARGLGTGSSRDVDLVEVLNGVADDYRRRATIDVMADHSSPWRGNDDALRRVLGNLVENAVVYGEGKPVTLRCLHDRRAMRIEVIDHGPGIPPAEREAVFQPFHRLEQSRNRSTGGSGLGLAIVKQLCDGNGWTISVADNPGGGSVFSLELPPAGTA